jgi:hypothetical protein
MIISIDGNNTGLAIFSVRIWICSLYGKYIEEGNTRAHRNVGFVPDIIPKPEM